MKHQKSFTLIELLIVITIIGILAVALVPRIASGPARARDVQRKADLGNLAAALELYYMDYGEYPDNGSAPESDCVATGSWFATAMTSYLDIPGDPGSNTSYGCSEDYYYKVMSYASGGSETAAYVLIAQLETPGANNDNQFCTSTVPTWLSSSDVETFISTYLNASGSYSCPDTYTYYVAYH